MRAVWRRVCEALSLFLHQCTPGLWRKNSSHCCQIAEFRLQTLGDADTPVRTSEELFISFRLPEDSPSASLVRLKLNC